MGSHLNPFREPTRVHQVLKFNTVTFRANAAGCLSLSSLYSHFLECGHHKSTCIDYTRLTFYSYQICLSKGARFYKKRRKDKLREIKKRQIDSQGELFWLKRTRTYSMVSFVHFYSLFNLFIHSSLCLSIPPFYFLCQSHTCVCLRVCEHVHVYVWAYVYVCI